MPVLTSEQLETLWELFKEQGVNAITWNHYELAEKTEENNPDMWKAFLMHPDVISWIQSEVALVQNAELKKMVKGAASTRSVGQAQLINAFTKLNDNTAHKEGPIFIYTHVPLNANQEHAPNTVLLANNPFIREE
jgi:hypothetical protein